MSAENKIEYDVLVTFTKSTSDFGRKKFLRYETPFGYRINEQDSSKAS
jgi:hypothetical protein